MTDIGGLGPAVNLPEICCDTCPYSPTCEEERDFLIDALSLDEDLADWEPQS